MFFPIGDTNIKNGTKPFFAYALIAINIWLFVKQIYMPAAEQQSYVLMYGCIPYEIMHAQDLGTLFTNMFLHGGWSHLIGNMLFLWIFGDNIEATIGYFKFILFYLIGGVVASLTHVYFNMGSVVPSIGASGAISACLGAYLVMFPTSKVKVFVLFLLSSVRVPAILFLGIWIAQQFLSGYGNLGKTIVGDNVAYWAHIGGFVYGVFAGLLFKSKAVAILKKERGY
jgi:membrane associated rhomboid family serine protease